MIPIAVGTGPGAEERRAIAVVIIGGQTLSLLLTLLATPVAYSFLDDLRALLRRGRVPAPAPAAVATSLPESPVAWTGAGGDLHPDGPVHAPSPVSPGPPEEPASRERLDRRG